MLEGKRLNAKDWMHQKILKYFIAGVHRQNNNKSY